MTTICGKRFCKGCRVEDRICSDMRAIEMYILLKDGKFPAPPVLRQKGRMYI